MPRGLLLLLALLACLTVAVLVGRFGRGRLQLGITNLTALSKRLSSSRAVASLTVTAKTLVGFYQVVSEVEEVFIMELPVKAVRLIKSFSWLDLAITDLIQLECLGFGGYLNELRFTAAAPALLMLLLGLGALFLEWAAETKRGWELVHGASLRALPWVLCLTFLVCPDVSSLAFQAFRCECFGDESWLRSDYSLQCTVGGCEEEHRTSTYVHTRLVAWTVLWVYALGVPAFYAVLLFRARHAIMEDESTPLADGLAFLHKDYRPTRCWWELANVAQKLVIVGFATLIMPGKLMQLVIVMLITAVFLLLLVLARPYHSVQALVLALVEQKSLLVFLVLCFIVKSEQLAGEVSEVFMTNEVHRSFFYDTELIANTMVRTLGAAVTFAALASLHQTVPIVMHAWREAVAFGLYEQTNSEAQSCAESRAAARAAAQKTLRSVLDQRVSALEVPEILHSEEAEINPVLRDKLAEAKERAKMRRAMSISNARRSQDGGASSSTRPKRLDGALRLLKLDIEEEEKAQTAESRARSLQLQLKRCQAVRSLVSEEMAADEVKQLWRRVRAASLEAPNVAPCDRHELWQLATFRMRLERKGWAGAEKISPRTRWDLSRHMILQGRLTNEEDAEEPSRRNETDSSAPPRLSKRNSQLEDLARAMFNRFDGNCDGLIDSEELSMLCAHLGHTLSHSQLNVAMQSLDVDGSGFVEFDEFMNWFELGMTADALMGRAAAKARLTQQNEHVAASKRRLEGEMVNDEASGLPRFALGQRVMHGKRGVGVVSELMEDGRIRVAFDNGEEHRYSPDSLCKLTPLSPAASPASLEVVGHEGTDREGGNAQGSAGDRALRSSLWAASRGTLTAVERMASQQRPQIEGSMSTPRRGAPLNSERAEMLETEKIIEQEASKRRGRRCSLSLKDGPGRETSRKPNARLENNGLENNGGRDRAPQSSLWSATTGAVAAVDRMSPVRRPPAEAPLATRRGARMNLEREEILESEQIIEREATRKRGRRCSLSLKDRPGRETCRNKVPTGTQQSTPCSVRGGISVAFV